MSIRTLALDHGSRALVVVPHPDDETFGCGGTIARLSSEGIEVYVIAVTVGDLPQWGAASDSRVRASEFQAACDALGVAGAEICWTGNDRHMQLDQVPQLELVKLLETTATYSLNAVRPDALFLPSAGSFNQDHQAVNRAAFTAARPHSPGLKPTPPIVIGFMMPEDSWTQSPQSPTVHVDISRHWESKERALACYKSQLRADGHPRSLKHIRDLDIAAGGNIGCTVAEAFVAYRVAFKA